MGDALILSNEFASHFDETPVTKTSWTQGCAARTCQLQNAKMACAVQNRSCAMNKPPTCR
jgi:hypothetical protein